MRKKKSGEHESGPAGGRITPAEVQQVEFRLAFRGYNERDVDAFLDRITEDLTAYLEETERLRATGAPAPPAPVSDSGAEDARREAEAIVSRARDEAAAIVRRAEQEAAAIRASGPVPAGDARHAVGPFLNQERDFLQNLGTLVQSHAEDVKQMVLALRARTESSTAVPAPPADPQPIVPSPVSDAASAAEIRERLGSPEPEPRDAEEQPPVVIESATEPAYSSEGAPANEGRERSLRELFWGED